jgi:vacuolar-type H+-ATPase subunit E/Vma4
MALEHLLAALERDAAAEAERLLAAARAEAAAIRAAAEERVAQRRAAALGARAAELRGRAERALGEARRGGRRLELEARQRLLGRVAAAARARLPAAMAAPEYRAALPAALAAALACAGEAAVVIRCPVALVAAVRDALPQGAGAAVEADAGVRAGYTLATADGVLTVDDTLDARLERLWPRLAPGVLARVEERGP